MCKSICASRTVKIIGFEHRWLKNTRGRLSSGLAGSRKEAPKAQVIYSRKGAIFLLQEGIASQEGRTCCAIDLIGNMNYQGSSLSFPALISALWWIWGKRFLYSTVTYWPNIYWTGILFRTVSFDVPPQEILTKDSVTVDVDAVVYYNIRSWVILNLKYFWFIHPQEPHGCGLQRLQLFQVDQAARLDHSQVKIETA